MENVTITVWKLTLTGEEDGEEEVIFVTRRFQAFVAELRKREGKRIQKAVGHAIERDAEHERTYVKKEWFQS